MKVVSSKICPFVQRVTTLLETKEIHYDIEYISLSNKPDWFLEISPNAQVPLLITDTGSVLFESDTIVEYLDEIYLPLEKKITPEQRALDRALSYQASKNYLVQCSFMRSADEKVFLEREKKMIKLFSLIEKKLSGNLYFKSNLISNVDVAWSVLLYRFSLIEKYTDYNILSLFPKARQWQTALASNSHVKKSVSQDFEQIFCNFYLSEQTFLGKMRQKKSI